MENLEKIYVLDCAMMNGTVRMNINYTGYASKELAEEAAVDVKKANENNDSPFGVSDYGYCCIRWICCGNTYEDCKQHLLESLESQEKAKNKRTIESTNYMYD